MQLARFQSAPGGPAEVGLIEGEFLRRLSGVDTLADVLHEDDPAAFATGRAGGDVVTLASVTLLAPLDRQEVWGAGVTYERSKTARQEESESGGSFYDQVYRADRPELFLKATPSRVVGPGQAIRIRRDTRWCVPEPELTLVLSPRLRLVGYTIGDDVSARDIEGRNPLYLPQAKVYEGSCALGPVVTLAHAAAAPFAIRLTIGREGATAFDGTTSTARMARTFDDLIAWLGRDNVFPDGVFLMTGTGLVPPDEFSLRPGDVVSITIDGIGTLVNTATQAPPTP